MCQSTEIFWVCKNIYTGNSVKCDPTAQAPRLIFSLSWRRMVAFYERKPRTARTYIHLLITNIITCIRMSHSVTQSMFPLKVMR